MPKGNGVSLWNPFAKKNEHKKGFSREDPFLCFQNSKEGFNGIEDEFEKFQNKPAQPIAKAW
ncbi:MAG: hypothetical protein GKR88_15350 [Flavobacteriaceae bacterium]|nr:MAG: hypothetical protein GKR88_15350 [Flavobacteriaceae bacterium]